MRPFPILLAFFLSLISTAASATWTPLKDSYYDASALTASSRFQSVYDPFDQTIFYTNATSNSIQFWLDTSDSSSSSSSSNTSSSGLFLIPGGFVAGGRRSGRQDGATCTPVGSPCETATFEQPRGLSPYFGPPHKGISGIVGLFVSDSNNNCIRFINLRDWTRETGHGGHVTGPASGLCHPFDGAGVAFGLPEESRFVRPHQMATQNRHGLRVVLYGNCVVWLDVFSEGSGLVTLSTRHMAGGCSLESTTPAPSGAPVFPGGDARDPSSLVEVIAAAFSPDGEALFVSDLVLPAGGIRKITPGNRVLAGVGQQLISGLMGRQLFSTATTAIVSVSTSPANTTTSTTSTAPNTTTSTATNTTTTVAGSNVTTQQEATSPPAPTTKSDYSATILGLDILQDWSQPFLLVFSTRLSADNELLQPSSPSSFFLPFGVSVTDTLSNSSRNSNSTTNNLDDFNISHVVDGPPAEKGTGLSEAQTVNIHTSGIITALQWVTYQCRWPCAEVAGGAYNGYNWYTREKPLGTTRSKSPTFSRTNQATDTEEQTASLTPFATQSEAESYSGNGSSETRSKSYKPPPDAPLIRGLNGAAYLNGVFLFVGALFYTDHWAAGLALSRQHSVVRCAVLAARNRHRWMWTPGGRDMALSWKQLVLLKWESTDPLVDKTHDEVLEPRKPPFAESPTQMRMGEFVWSEYTLGAMVGNAIFGASFLLALSGFAMYRLSKKQSKEIWERAQRIKRRRKGGLDVSMLRLAASGDFPANVRDLLGRGAIVEYFLLLVLAWLFPVTLSWALVICARDWMDIYGLRTAGIVVAAVLPVVVLGVVFNVLVLRNAPRMEVWKETVLPSTVKSDDNEQEEDEEKEEQPDQPSSPPDQSSAAAAVSIPLTKKQQRRAKLLEMKKQKKLEGKKASWTEWLFLPRGEWEFPPDVADQAMRAQEAALDSSSSSSSDVSTEEDEDEDEDDAFSSPSRRNKKKDKKNKNKNDAALLQLEESSYYQHHDAVQQRQQALIEFRAALPITRCYMPNRQWMIYIDLLSQLLLAFAEFMCVWFDDDVTFMAIVILVATIIPALLTAILSPYSTRFGTLQVTVSAFLFQLPSLILVILLQEEVLVPSGGDPAEVDAVKQIGNAVGGLMMAGASIICVLSVYRWVVVRIRPWWNTNEEKIQEKLKRKEKRAKRRAAALAARKSDILRAAVAAGKDVDAVGEELLREEIARTNAFYSKPGWELSEEERKKENLKVAKAMATVSGGGGLARLIAKKQLAANDDDDEGGGGGAKSSSSPARAKSALKKKQQQYADSDEERELMEIRRKVDVDKRQRKFAKRNPDVNELFEADYAPALLGLSDRELEAFMPKAERLRRARALFAEQQEERALRLEQERQRRLDEEQRQLQHKRHRRPSSPPRQQRPPPPPRHRFDDDDDYAEYDDDYSTQSSYDSLLDGSADEDYWSDEEEEETEDPATQVRYSML